MFRRLDAPVIKTRKIKGAVLRNMNASLFNRDWNVLVDMSVDQCSEALMREIATVLDFYAPGNKKIKK